MPDTLKQDTISVVSLLADGGREPRRAITPVDVSPGSVAPRSLAGLSSAPNEALTTATETSPDVLGSSNLLADASELATALALKASKGPVDHENFHARIIKIRKLLLAADRSNRLIWATGLHDEIEGEPE